MRSLSRKAAIDAQKKIADGSIKIPSTAIHSSVVYNIFENKNAILRSYSQKLYDDSDFIDWSETTMFEANQIQDVIGSEVSDSNWQIAK